MMIEEQIPLFLNHLKTLGYSGFTLERTKYSLRRFMRFLEQERIRRIEELEKDLLSEYQQELAFHITAKGTPLARGSQIKLMSTVKSFTRFLKERDLILHDPGESVRLPGKIRHLPKVILSHSEIRTLVRTPDTRTKDGFRDRVILEILYDTAIRRSEMSRIRLENIDLAGGYIHIHGKGDKERVVPLSRRVCCLAGEYILKVRPAMLKDKDDGYLILNRWGARMHHMGVWASVKKWARLSGIQKRISPHTLRHTCATHMLKNGAPLRHVQELLGHESPESTQIYTRVTINDLKQIHEKYHPGDNL